MVSASVEYDDGVLGDDSELELVNSDGITLLNYINSLNLNIINEKKNEK